MIVEKPRCLHGEPWDKCAVCATFAWCRECLELVIIDPKTFKAARGDEITCDRCDRLIIASRS